MSTNAPENVQELILENQQLKERLSDFRQLGEVLTTISSALQVNEVIEKIVEETLTLCEADQGAVVLLDPSGLNEARTLIRQAESESVKLDHFLNMMLSGWVSQHGECLITENIAGIVGDSHYKGKYQDIAAALSVPLSIKGEMIGTLSLIRLKDQPPFDEREKDLMTILGTTFAQFIHHARLHDSIFEETLRLRKEVQTQYALHGIIGKSAALQRVFKLLERIIPTDARLLIEGESGTGKELIARVTHYSGPRKEKPFVAIDCGALPANLLEAELFGYMKGAFTGAQKDKKGLFEVADGGTLFLDEISNMPLEIQSKFLRTLQEGEIRPLGSTKVRKVDVRVIAAGSGNLKNAVDEGTFRQDLYYRLNVVSLILPPLRERRGDVVILANHFLEKMAERHKKGLKGFKASLMSRMENYTWPGNVRELENVVERMVILAEDNQTYLEEDLLPIEIQQGPTVSFSAIGGSVEFSSGDIKNQKAQYEKHILEEALRENKWNQSAAARQLGISERTVRYKMKKFNIQRP